MKKMFDSKELQTLNTVEMKIPAHNFLFITVHYKHFSYMLATQDKSAAA